MKPPSPDYIAAFFDAEGCVNSGIQRGRAHLHLTFSQSTSQVLLDIRSALGVGTVRQTCQGQYVLIITGAPTIRRVIRIIYPYSRIKRKQLKLAYEFTKLVGKHRGIKITSQAGTRRLEIHHELRQLKRQGGVSGTTKETE